MVNLLDQDDPSQIPEDFDVFDLHPHIRFDRRMPIRLIVESYNLARFAGALHRAGYTELADDLLETSMMVLETSKSLSIEMRGTEAEGRS